jgi:hypothetical protein
VKPHRKPLVKLTYEGETLTHWNAPIPYGWGPSFGTVLAVPYRGKLTLFRAIGKTSYEILLDIIED